jgi:penicillin-binding protein 1A
VPSGGLAEQILAARQRSGACKGEIMFTNHRKMALICMTLAVVTPLTAWGGSLQQNSSSNRKLGLNASQLVTLATSNQLVLERVADPGILRAWCYCGPSITWEQVPKHLWQALVAVEDRRFFAHRGLDPLGIARALKRNLLARQLIEGGSTITQQLCKNKILQSSKSLTRKIAEARCAVQLEGVMSKQQILLAYLNGTYFGHTDEGKPIIGVEQASRVYFGKSAMTVSLLESAILAGMQRAPNAYRPDRHHRESLRRAEVVLDSMVHEEFISEKAAKTALKSGTRPGRLTQVTFDFRYFRDWVLSDLSKAGLTLEPGTRIPLTLEVTTQGNAEKAFRTSLDKFSNRSERQAAFITMKLDGRVAALSGGWHYESRQFNNATQARRQPASAFKPFVYLAAVESGLTASSRLDDFPYAGEQWTESIVSHQNGRISMRSALAKSANIATIRLCRRIGAKKVAMAAKRLGITSTIPTGSCRIAIGECEVTPLELTGAYAALANGGSRVDPFGFWGATSPNGEVICWRRDSRKRVAQAKHVRMMKQMLRAVVTEGTGKPAIRINGAAGKTGTSNDGRDAWFVGFTRGQVTTVWIGKEKSSDKTKDLTGTDAARVWANIVGAFPKS